MKRLLYHQFVLMLAAQAASICAQRVAAQTEVDYDKLITVITSQALTDSRAKSRKTVAEACDRRSTICENSSYMNPRPLASAVAMTNHCCGHMRITRSIEFLK